MSAPLGNTQSRFRLESHDHAGNFICSLPYQNAQVDYSLNSNGQALRVDVPYRGYNQVIAANLYPGKHELWLYDTLVSDTNPIFAGPLWDATASSSSGVIACSAQDPLSYLAKRLLKTFKRYRLQTATFIMNDLMAYVQSQRAININTNIVVASTQTTSQIYQSTQNLQISDLLDTISQVNEGVDYYMRTVGGVHQLYLYGGQIKPSTALPFVLDYGGNLDGHSVQYNAQAIANDWSVTGANGRVGNAVSATKQTEYNALYQAVGQSDQVASADLNNTATIDLKDTQSAKVIPSLVTHRLTPIKDFDFGSQFQVVIDDFYVQVNQTIRVVGWQLTIGQGDRTTTIIYTKDTEGVT